MSKFDTSGFLYDAHSNHGQEITSASFSLFLDGLLEFQKDFLHQVSQLVSQHIQDILNRRDLSRKYVLENINGNYLKQEPLDSSSFVDYCGLEECS